jgi:hypothetical protein
MQMPMTGEPTHRKLDKDMTQFGVSLFSESAKDVEGDGCLYMLMLKVRKQKWGQNLHFVTAC